MRKLIIVLAILLISSFSNATVSTTDRKVQYNCDGVITNYTYAFQVYEDDDLIVRTSSDSDINGTTLTLNVDYSVTGAGDEPGGQVVLSAGSKCGSGELLTIDRSIDLLQRLDFVDGEAFSAEDIEQGLDKAMLTTQDVNSKISRAPLLRETTTSGPISLPEPSAGQYLRWASDLSGFENVTFNTTSDPVVVNASRLSFYSCNFATAVATIGATKTHLIIDCVPDALTADVTIPDNITLEWRAGFILTGAYTFTVNGYLLAGNYQLFGPNISVTSSTSVPINEVSIMWFGSKGDGVTDDTATTLLAANFAVSVGAKMIVPPGDYIINDLLLPVNIWVSGTGSQNSNLTTLKTSQFRSTTGTFCVELIRNSASPGSRIENLTILGTGTQDYGLKAIGTSVFLNNLSINGFTNGVGLLCARFWRGSVESIYIYNCGIGLMLGSTDAGYGPVNGTSFTDVTIEISRVGLYSANISSAPQVFNQFDTLIIEGCGAKYHTGLPNFITTSTEFTTDTGMNGSNLEGAIILEQNFYVLFNALYLEINSGVYFWQGSTGKSVVNGGIIEMLEPSNDYTGSPIYNIRSELILENVRLSWDDSLTSPLLTLSSARRSKIKGIIFATTGTTRDLYFDGFLTSSNIRIGSWELQKRDNIVMQPKLQSQTHTIIDMDVSDASARIPCDQGSIFLWDGLTQGIGVDADYFVDGQEVTLIFVQDATGGRNITLSSSIWVDSFTNTGNSANTITSITYRRISDLGKFIQVSGQNAWN